MAAWRRLHAPHSSTPRSPASLGPLCAPPPPPQQRCTNSSSRQRAALRRLRDGRGGVQHAHQRQRSTMRNRWLHTFVCEDSLRQLQTNVAQMNRASLQPNRNVWVREAACAPARPSFRHSDLHIRTRTVQGRVAAVLTAKRASIGGATRKPLIPVRSAHAALQVAADAGDGAGKRHAPPACTRAAAACAVCDARRVAAAARRCTAARHACQLDCVAAGWLRQRGGRSLRLRGCCGAARDGGAGRRVARG